MGAPSSPTGVLAASTLCQFRKAEQNVSNIALHLKWSEPVRKSALRRLYAVDAATNLLDLRSPPSNHLEKLRGDRDGQYSVRQQWRTGLVRGRESCPTTPSAAAIPFAPSRLRVEILSFIRENQKNQ